MDPTFLTYLGAFLVLGWGVAHLFPTRAVVKGFGDISADNRRIITMEWLIEGLALIFIGLLAALVTWVGTGSPVTRVVSWLTFSFLNVLSVVTLCTGFRNSFFVFKLCPFILTGSSLLILWGNGLM